MFDAKEHKNPNAGQPHNFELFILLANGALESFGFGGEDVGPFVGVRVFRKTRSAFTWEPSP